MITDGYGSSSVVPFVPKLSVPPDPAPEAGVRSNDVIDPADFGPLAPFLAREEVTDVLLNGAEGLWISRGAGTERVPEWSSDERTVRDLAIRLIALGGRHVDESSPCVDVRLQRGIRVHAVLPPISVRGTLLSIRVPRREVLGLPALVGDGTITDRQRTLLLRAIADRANLLVTGAAGSGKTTLLAALLGEASHAERIVAIEDVAELRIAHPHVVSLEARQANLEGAGAVGVERLVREALRMRPDRLVVGECRGSEVRELLAALNTGHDGGAGTLHANSLADVPARLEALGALAGLSPFAIARQAVSAIGLVLHLEHRGTRRALAAIGRLGLDERDRLCVRPVEPG